MTTYFFLSFLQKKMYLYSIYYFNNKKHCPIQLALVFFVAVYRFIYISLHIMN